MPSSWFTPNCSLSTPGTDVSINLSHYFYSLHPSSYITCTYSSYTHTYLFYFLQFNMVMATTIYFFLVAMQVYSAPQTSWPSSSWHRICILATWMWMTQVQRYKVVTASKTAPTKHVVTECLFSLSVHFAWRILIVHLVLAMKVFTPQSPHLQTKTQAVQVGCWVELLCSDHQTDFNRQG